MSLWRKVLSPSTGPWHISVGYLQKKVALSCVILPLSFHYEQACLHIFRTQKGKTSRSVMGRS